MKKIYFPVVAALIVLAASFFGARPAHAGLFQLWDNIQCAADINCTITAASSAALNYGFRTAVGAEFDDGRGGGISADDVNRMAHGEWDRGLIATVGKIGSLAYAIPPTGHVTDFIKNELSDNILNSKAVAQTGTEILNPIAPFWRGTRDAAYGLFAIVMVVIGLMIILRKEISPRVTATFTSALPRIFMGLILITFSYPLIALIVDIGAFFGSALVVTITAQQVISSISSNVAVSGAADLVSTFMALFVGNLITSVSGAITGGLLQLVTLVILIFGGIVLFVLTCIRLLSAYVWILIYTIFSPLIILLGSLPGQEGSITDFGKKILAKTLVFPLILFFFILALGFATMTLSPAAATILTGGNFGQVIGNSLLFSRTFLGPILTLFMLAGAFKAPGYLDEALEINKPRKKK